MQSQIEKYAELLKEYSFIEVKNIQDVNHKPHPYCITEKHVAYVSDHYNGMLSTQAVQSLEKEKGRGMCGMYISPDGKQISNGHKSGWKRCDKYYDEHTSNRVMFIKLKQNVDKETFRKAMKILVPEFKKDKIDGISLIETKEKFRIT